MRTSPAPPAAVLAVYAELDGRVNASRDAATAALRKANFTHEIVTYPDADHAFFNDTGQRFNSGSPPPRTRSSPPGSSTHLA